MSVRGECIEDGWESSGGVVPFSWWFFVGLVSASASSIVLSSLVWLNITSGWKMELIYPSYTSCIVYSYPMCPARYGVMAELVGKFLANSTYSESPPFPPKLAADVTSLSGSACNLGDVA